MDAQSVDQEDEEAMSGIDVLLVILLHYLDAEGPFEGCGCIYVYV